jgi:hypothetical protein
MWIHLPGRTPKVSDSHDPVGTYARREDRKIRLEIVFCIRRSSPAYEEIQIDLLEGQFNQDETGKKLRNL